MRRRRGGTYRVQRRLPSGPRRVKPPPRPTPGSAKSSHAPVSELETMLRSRFAALVLIVAGALLLLSNLGLMPRLGPLFHQWWPLLLIVLGVLMLVQRL